MYYSDIRSRSGGGAAPLPIAALLQTESLRVAMTLARWRGRLYVRRLAHQVRHTLHGKFGLMGAVCMTVVLARIATQGFLTDLPNDPVWLSGLLLAARGWLAISLWLMILSQLSREFLSSRRDEPLEAFPALVPALARHRVFATTVHTAVPMTALYCVYFWQPLVACLDRPWLALPVHLLATGLAAVVLGVSAGAFGRWLLSHTSLRGMRGTGAFVSASGTVAIAAFAGLLLGIMVVHEYATGVFRVLGRSVGALPYAAAAAAGDGRWVHALIWIAAGALAAAYAVRITYRWSRRAHLDLPVDLAAPASRAFAPLFSGRSGRRLPRGLQAFWRKDVLVRHRRDTKRYLFQQWNLLCTGIAAVILAAVLRERGTVDEALASSVPVFAALGMVAGLAMLQGIDSLGREGRELTWLRPVISGSRLMLLEVVVNAFHVLTLAAVYALVLSLTARLLSLETTLPALLAFACGAAPVFTCLATTLGWLLPDFERRSCWLPGATKAGISVYLTFAVLLVMPACAFHLLFVAGRIAPLTYVQSLAVLVGCASALIWIAARAGLARYRSLEL